MSDHSEGRRGSLLGRHAPKLLLGAVVLFVVIQLVPYRVQNHPAAAEPNWDSVRTQALVQSACADCHSNHTRPRWYEKVAPISWWITSHVDDGRGALNFSECGKRGGEGDDAAETVREGSMPPSYYTWFGLHPDAKLNASDRRALADGLAATAGRGCLPAG